MDASSLQGAVEMLPSTYDVVRAEFQKQRSLRIPYLACVAAIHKAGLHVSSMSDTAVEIYLDKLAAAVPEWLTVAGSGEDKHVRIAQTCTGVRRKLEIVSRQKML
jgi:hypothetical protein